MPCQYYFEIVSETPRIFDREYCYEMGHNISQVENLENAILGIHIEFNINLYFIFRTEGLLNYEKD